MRKAATVPLRKPRPCLRPRPYGWAALSTASIVLIALLGADGASATICKYIDAEGNTHYSNLPPERGWRRLSCVAVDDPIPRRSEGGTQRANAPASFPRVDPETQKSRDEMRRKVLSDELATEQKLLAESRLAYADGAPPPLPEERADAEKYRSWLARLRESVTVHERNVDALKKELSAIK